MEQKLEQAYLYDFYGELLKDRQRKIYEDFVFNDLSLGEIAEEEGISRQGVHDMVRRCTKALESYEERLHLVQKFRNTKERVAKIHALAGEFRASHAGPASGQDLDQMLDEIEQISNAILEDL